MSDNDPGQGVAVPVGACRCPGTPHAQDEVYLAPEVSLTMGLRATGAIAKAKRDAALLESLLGRVFIEDGIVDWTFVEEVEGEQLPVPITPWNIERLLPWAKGGALVAEAANELYWPVIKDPLVKRLRGTSPHTPTNGSISHTQRSPRTRRNSSKSSSPESSASSA